MIKPGVRINGIRPELVLGFCQLIPVFQKYGHFPTITAIIDGAHSKGSLHYTGAAMDLRSRDISVLDQQKILTEGKLALGQDAANSSDFDFILEGDHFHLEYQPKLAYG